MGLLSTTVEIGITGRTVNYFEELGYKIPRYTDVNGQYRVKNGTKIVINVDDLPKGSGCNVLVECDCCKTKYYKSYQSYNYSVHIDGKIYCNHCAPLLLNSGRNHPRYNDNLTDEERTTKRNYIEYQKFVKKVLYRDNFVCQCCGQRGGDLEVHHLNGYDCFKEERTDETNGVTLCKTCHKNFHLKYGMGKNTKEQYEEWVGISSIFLEKYESVLPQERHVYCYEENKIYLLSEIVNNWNVSKYVIYDICGHYQKYNKNTKQFNYKSTTLKGKHLFWYDEYINLSENEIQYFIQQKSKIRRKVICINSGKIYNTLIEAQKDTGINITSISYCCKGKTKHTLHKVTKEHIFWMYYDEYLKQQVD